MAMGMAEVVPGVSGGTIAFITGIYERLLTSIKNMNPALIKVWKAEGIAGVWKKIDGNFLAWLLAGMGIGVIVGVFLITYLIDNHPLQVWSFFFGLMLASAWYVGKQMERWRIYDVLLLTCGTVVAYYVTIASPGQGNPALWFLFVSGAIAVSALMLPGLSGSFVLLLMGMYTYVVTSMKDFLKTFDFDKFIVLFVFGMGMLLGLALFSRVLTWTFKNYRHGTLALLTGFIIGSLNKVWPWQEVLATQIKDDGEESVTFTKSVWPTDFAALEENFFYGTDPHLIGCIVFMVVGFVLVFALEKMAVGNPENER